MSTTLPDILATFDRCERDRQPITPSMWDALRSLARKADVDLAWYIDRHSERTVTEAEDAHLEAELARVGALSDDDCKAELAAEGIDYEASRKRMDVLLRTLTERTILKAKLTDTEADLATLRLEHESWGAIIDGLRASLATVTRERDEARQPLATEEHNHELTIARRDDAQSWADSLANQIAEAAGHEIGEHSNLNNPWDNAQDGLVKLVRERDELRAALLNERGEGPPPSEGWARNDFDRRAVGIAWYRPSNADGSPPPAGAMDYAYVLWVYREPMEPEWTWECEHADFSSRNIQGKAPTAREAMRAADTALAGAKS